LAFQLELFTLGILAPGQPRSAIAPRSSFESHNAVQITRPSLSHRNLSRHSTEDAPRLPRLTFRKQHPDTVASPCQRPRSALTCCSWWIRTRRTALEGTRSGLRNLRKQQSPRPPCPRRKQRPAARLRTESPSPRPRHRPRAAGPATGLPPPPTTSPLAGGQP